MRTSCCPRWFRFSGLAALPATVEVRQWVNSEVIFPHTALLATHGGQASVSAALVHDVPVVVMPLGRDQSDVGSRVRSSSVGRMLDRDASVSDVRETMAAILTDSGYRSAARELGAELRALSNGAVASDALAELGSRLRPAATP